MLWVYGEVFDSLLFRRGERSVDKKGGAELDRIERLKIGIVIERRRIDNPWVDYSWRAVSVFSGAPDIEEWQSIQSGPDWVQFHAATLDLELFRRETEGYLYNLSMDKPSLYVLMRRGEEAEDHDVEPHHVTACPYEALAYANNGDDIVDSVPMPPEVLGMVRDFIQAFHVDEPQYKRKRDKVDPDKLGFSRRKRERHDG
tara:strand:+ start:91080 stop:91679 length:600 start_codon:yes stop_codon:yes gene_type:complete